MGDDVPLYLWYRLIRPKLDGVEKSPIYPPPPEKTYPPAFAMRLTEPREAAQVIRVDLVAGSVFRCDIGTKVENHPWKRL